MLRLCYHHHRHRSPRRSHTCGSCCSPAAGHRSLRVGPIGFDDSFSSAWASYSLPSFVHRRLNRPKRGRLNLIVLIWRMTLVRSCTRFIVIVYERTATSMPRYTSEFGMRIDSHLSPPLPMRYGAPRSYPIVSSCIVSEELLGGDSSWEVTYTLFT